MPSRPFATLGAILLGTIGLSFVGQSLSQQIAPVYLAGDITNEPPGYGGGRGAHYTNSGGARAHRRWKKRRAAGLHKRVRR